MLYALQAGESVEESVQRIARGTLRRALRDLAELPSHEAHHAIRKGCKKVRALLRLVRKPLGPTFALENAWYRDFARGLAGVRDAQAVIEAWTWLAEGGDGIPPVMRIRVRNALEARRDRLADSAAPAPSDLREQLEQARQRSRSWRLGGDGFDAIAAGLRRSYGRARSTMPDAGARRSVAAMHLWRRRAKDHWYHLRMIDTFWPSELKGRTQALAQLTEDLGRFHDLDILAAALREVAITAADRATADQCIAAAASGLADASGRLGRHLFAERPKSFVARVRAHHDIWRRRATDT